MTAAVGVCTLISKTALGKCSVDGGSNFSFSFRVRGRWASLRSSTGKRIKLWCMKAAVLVLILKLGCSILLGLYTGISIFLVLPSIV